MRRALPSAVGLSLVLLAPFALACKPAALPGQDVGTYDVTGTLDENACAPGLPAMDPLTFSVQLRRDHGSLIWRIMPDGAPISGTVGDDGTIHLHTDTRVQAWAADPSM